MKTIANIEEEYYNINDLVESGLSDDESY